MRRGFSCTELCEVCEEYNRGWDSADSSVERTSSAKAEKKHPAYECTTCSICGKWIAKPHFQLHVLRGRVAEPLDPHSFEMKPSLWSSLPLECLWIILARLPLGSRVRFSMVCKSWQSLLASSDFKRLCDSLERPPALPVCSLEYKVGKLAPCQPRYSRPSGIRDFEVLNVGLSFLSPKFQAFLSSDYVAHDGLICIFKVERQKPKKPHVETKDEVVGMSLCIANPIMRTFKELPPEFGKEDDFHDQRRSRVQLKVEESGHFTVTVLCVRKKMPTLSMYRSKDNSWKATALAHPQWFCARLPYHNYSSRWPQYVLCNDELCTAGSFNFFDVDIHCVKSGQVIWDGELESRDEDDEDTVPRAIQNVFAWRGRIFCLEQDYEEHGVDFGVWELERSPYMWRKVSILPEQLQEMLLNPERLRRANVITLRGATLLGDTMYFTIGTSSKYDDDFLHTHLVGYNILDNTWCLIEGLGTFFWSNWYHLFRPNDVGV